MGPCRPLVAKPSWRPGDVGRSTKPAAEVLQIRQPTSLKVGRVAVAQALARCVPAAARRHPRHLERVGGAVTDRQHRLSAPAQERGTHAAPQLLRRLGWCFDWQVGARRRLHRRGRGGLCGFRRHPHHQSRIRPGTCRLAAVRPRSMHRGCRETWSGWRCSQPWAPTCLRFWPRPGVVVCDQPAVAFALIAPLRNGVTPRRPHLRRSSWESRHRAPISKPWHRDQSSPGPCTNRP
jgi:hypothetical protein